MLPSRCSYSSPGLGDIAASAFPSPNARPEASEKKLARIAEFKR
jgi:hypothetical protein